MEAAWSFETLVPYYITTRGHNSDDGLNYNRRVNFKYRFPRLFPTKVLNEILLFPIRTNFKTHRNLRDFTPLKVTELRNELRDILATLLIRGPATGHDSEPKLQIQALFLQTSWHFQHVTPFQHNWICRGEI